MILLGALIALFFPGVSPNFPPLSPPVDCVEAHRLCLAEPRCEALYRGLERCAAVFPLGEQVADECLERQEALLSRHSALATCKCQRGFRREEQCLRIYWRVRLLPGEDELETSPYDDTLMDTRMASLMAASTFMQLDEENHCLKAAQDCGLYEKCGSLRSEYVLACTKPIPGINRCNQNKCHRALRRFLDRVPEEYSLGLLFCPCTNALCGERRRKTIVPSCSYQDMDGMQPNCLHQQSFCRRDDTCRSRLADFLSNCQPSSVTASGCLKDSAGLCLRAYSRLIGTMMTPNYISNSSSDVSLWCHCEGSGIQWQNCLRLQRMFTHNSCLRNSISWIGSPGSLPLDITSPPAPRPSPLVQEDELLSNNHLPDNNIVVESVEEEELTKAEVEEEDEVEEDDEEEGNEAGDQFDIPLYSERAPISNLGSSGTAGAAATTATPPPRAALLLLLLLTAPFSWG